MEEALRENACGSIRAVQPLGGGCINRASRVDTERGPVLLKWNASASAPFFAAEVDGLEALAAAVEASGAQVVVPRPMAHGESAEGAWLLTEFVQEASASRRTFEQLGVGLALIHGESASGGSGSKVSASGATANEASGESANEASKESASGDSTSGAPGRGGSAGTWPGWHADNWIGSLPQANEPASPSDRLSPRDTSAWAAFWAERRLHAQLEVARRSERCRAAVFDRVFEVVSLALPSDLPMGLLHGDLWSGNFMARGDEVPVLIDPAVYIGHGEVDLAMTELFGGFDPAFRDAYRSIRPISAEYGAFRRELYQLYSLLVHVNLFGLSYEAAAENAATHVVRALT